MGSARHAADPCPSIARGRGNAFPSDRDQKGRNGIQRNGAACGPRAALCEPRSCPPAPLVPFLPPVPSLMGGGGAVDACGVGPGWGRRGGRAPRAVRRRGAETVSTDTERQVDRRRFRVERSGAGGAARMRKGRMRGKEGSMALFFSPGPLGSSPLFGCQTPRGPTSGRPFFRVGLLLCFAREATLPDLRTDDTDREGHGGEGYGKRGQSRGNKGNGGTGRTRRRKETTAKRRMHSWIDGERGRRLGDRGGDPSRVAARAVLMHCALLLRAVSARSVIGQVTCGALTAGRGAQAGRGEGPGKRRASERKEKGA